MWELDHEESWVLKNWCFWTVVLEKSLESPLDCKESILKEISCKYSLEGLMMKLKVQCCGHLMWRTDSLEKTLMLGKIEGRRRRGWQRKRWLDGITDSMLKQALGVGDGQGSLACCNSRGCKQSDMTEQLNWTDSISNCQIHHTARIIISHHIVHYIPSTYLFYTWKFVQAL